MNTKRISAIIAYVLIFFAIIASISYDIISYNNLKTYYLTSEIAINKNSLIFKDNWVLKDCGDCITIEGHDNNISEDNIVLPIKVNEKPVKYYSDFGNLATFNLFIPGSNYMFSKKTNIRAINYIFLSVNPNDYSNGFWGSEDNNYSIYRNYDVHIYVPKTSISKYKELYTFDKDQPSIMPANISLMYNYEGAPNDGYYWVDARYWLWAAVQAIDFSVYGEPKRDGYRFVGWSFFEDSNQLITENDCEEKIATNKEIVLFAQWERENA